MADLNQSTGDSAELSKTVMQLAKIVAMQSKQLDSLVKLVEKQTAANQIDAKSELMDSLSKRITVYSYDPTGENSFESWYALNADILEEEAKSLPDAARARLLRHRIDQVAHERFAHFILPKEPRELDYKDTLATLLRLFKRQESDFCLRWKCLQVAKKETEDFTAYTARVNKACEDFKLNRMTGDQFKCLIFILGLRNSKEADIRARLHNKLDTSDDPSKICLGELAEEAGRLIKLKHDIRLGSDEPAVRAVQDHKQKPRKSSPKQQSEQEQGTASESPRYPCWRCGAMHFTRDCNYSDHKCSRCDQVGHKEGYCNVGPGKKGAEPKQKQVNVVKLPGAPEAFGYSWVDNETPTTVSVVSPSQESADRPLLVNKLNSDSHRKYIDVQINGKLVSFQLDTGADVSILTRDGWGLIGCPPVQPPPSVPVSANNSELPVIGFLDVEVGFNGLSRRASCYVTDTDTNLFGGPWMSLFGLWELPPAVYCRQIIDFSGLAAAVSPQLRAEYEDVFSPSLGCCAMPALKLHLDRPQEDFVVAAIREEQQMNDILIAERNEEAPLNFEDIRIATEQDSELQKAIDYTRNGWPPSASNCKTGEMGKFFEIRSHLSILNGVLIFRDRTWIPRPLRLGALQNLHATHPGMTRMQALARAYVYWPGINQDIVELVRQCQACQEMAHAPVKTTLSPWPIPSGP